ncbi:Sphingosine-1-phosphate lyase [Aphelenchoides bicaudatus]|nr:Sphingosine-1-phosphate lyase [Aphelenchoides bicaudatus]
MEFDEKPLQILLHFFDDLRVVFNRSLDHLEPWQVVMYTMSAILFIQWVRKIAKIDSESSVSRSWHNILMNVSTYSEKIEQQKDAALKEIEEKLLRFDLRREFYKFLPEKGLEVDDIVAEATEYKTMGDPLFERGRVSGGVYNDDGVEEYKELMLKIFALYSHSNANFVDIFPGIRKMEAEVIRMLCSLYHGPSKACGTITTSATESIILACNAYKNMAIKRGIRKPEIIIGRNADVSFNEAAKLLGLRIVRVSMDENGCLDLASIKRAISLETCMIVASAPSFVTGLMDDVEQIAKLGVRFGIPVHVDASVGGFLLPFMEQCDYAAPMYDFRLSGVTSISIDLHKYAYCPVGSSAILYREQNLLQAQCFSDVYWSGGVYITPTLSGSRPGSLVALTWATLLWNGRLGYVERTQRILDATLLLKEKLETSNHVEVIGTPLLSSIIFKTKNSKIHVYLLGDLMAELGWNLAFIQKPQALKICISLKQSSPEIITEFCDDLNRCCERIERNADQTPPPKMHAIYGVSSSFIDRGIIEDLPGLFLQIYYSTPLGTKVRSARTLSIEGRKLSSFPSGGTNLAALQEQYNARKFSTTLQPHIE